MLIEEYISIEQSKALSRLLPGVLLTVLSITILSAFVLSTHFPKHIVLPWVSSMLLLAIILWMTTKSFTVESTNVSNYKKRLNMFTFWAVMNGLSWGSSAYVFSDPNAPIYDVYLICISSSYLATAMITSSAYMPVILSFVASILSLFFFKYVTTDSLLYQYLGFGIPLYFGVMWVFAGISNKAFKSARKIEFENAALLKEITLQKNLAETAVIDKNRFIASTSHDLRQPLHALNLYIDALRLRLTHETDIHILDRIVLSRSALNDLLHSLLDISRLDASVVENRPQHVRLKTLGTNLKEEFLSQVEQLNLELIVDIDEEHIVHVDPMLFERVLRNLLSNAVKYTRKGSIKLSSSLQGSQVQVAICDTGIGIASNKINEMFLEFTQIDNPERDRTKGLGLGLSIVKRLCDLQNIELLFESELGKGTQVRIMIDHGNPALIPLPFSSLHSNFDSLTILCIDDEEAIRDAMNMVITSWKCRPLIVEDSRSALDEIRKLDVPLDLIISDLRLRNEESGIELIQSIREELNEDVPALIITGDTAVDRIELAHTADVELMFKPIKTTELRQMIEQVLKKRSD